jgi:hypothetical protein
MTGLDAGGAYHHFLDPSVRKGADSLQIWIESAFGQIVSVTYMMADHRPFPANFTHPCHMSSP